VAIGTITLALLTFGIFIITVINLNQIFDDWGKRIQVIVYMDEDTSSEGIKKVKEKIINLTQTENIIYVSKERALITLKKSLHNQNGILDNLDDNPLPASFEIQLKEEYKNLQSVQAFVARVKGIDEVSDAEYGQEWLEKFSAFISMVKLVGVSIGCFLLLATIIIISNTIKLTIYSRREEIEIMKLVGATNFFIQTPFFLEGFIQGLSASLLSLGILFVSYKILISKIIIDYSLYLGYLDLIFLPQKLIIELILLGILLGLFGCAFSMGRFLKA
ncbi:MAG: permease-like cell division protein FtsX, partial [Deltaproteobacteria bacterium]|nr:permease-like cell division protein FtsX [Deltaproteobacteria bacterium]